MSNDEPPRHRYAPDPEAMADAISRFLDGAGLAAEAAADAAERSAVAWADELLGGYHLDPADVLECTFDEDAGDLVTVSGVPFVSVCAHHLLPFFGTAHVAYLPGDRLLGLGRMEELVRCMARRLQLQERLGQSIADLLVEHVGAGGAACVLEAEHLCVFARGQRQRGPITRTAAFAGELRDDPDFRQQCMTMLAGAHQTGASE